jgi:hypothetical protein
MPAACNTTARSPAACSGPSFATRAGLPVINVAGCPPHPDWITETLAMLAHGRSVAEHLDDYGRPRFFADQLVHHGCPRNEYYEFKASAEKHSDQGCLMEQLGCKGTQAHADCNQRLWNGEGSCLRGGYACIRCTEPGFEEPGHAFETTPKVAGIPIGLPADMPKAWFIALAALSKSATPARVRENATADHQLRAPSVKRARNDDPARRRPLQSRRGRPRGHARHRRRAGRAAYVNSPLYRGFEQILQGKLPADALVLVPRICGICSVAQSAAAALALADAAGIAPPPNGRLAANLTLAAENLADHLTHFYLFFMPDFARADYESRRWHHGAVERFRATVGSAPNEVLPARARFMQAMGLLAGKWPHTLAVQPGGSTRPLQSSEIFRLHRILREFRGFLEGVTFGRRWRSSPRSPAVANWMPGRKGRGGDLRSFLAIAADLDLWRLGRGTDRFMSYGCYAGRRRRLFPAGVWHRRPVAGARRRADRRGHGHAWYAATGRPQHPAEGSTCRWRTRRAPIPGARRRAWADRWWKPAHWRGRWWPAIRWCATWSPDGGSVAARVVARLLELALVLPAMERWLDRTGSPANLGASRRGWPTRPRASASSRPRAARSGTG